MTRICFVLLAFVSSFSVIAQVDTTGEAQEVMQATSQSIEIKVLSASVRHPKAFIPGVYVEMTASVASLKSFWTGLAKSEYSMKLKDKKEVLLAKGVHVPEITHQEIDIYSSIGIENEKTRFNIGVVFANGQYLDSTYFPDNFVRLKQFVEKIAKRYYMDYYNGLLEKLQDQNADLIRGKEKLVNQKNRRENDVLQFKTQVSTAEKNIIKAERLIEKSQTKINQEQQQIELDNQGLGEKQMEIEAKQSEIGATDSLEQKRLLVKEKEKLDKELSKIRKSMANSEKKVVKEKEKITRNEATIKLSRDEITTSEDGIRQGEIEIKTLERDIEEKEKQISVKEEQISGIKSKMTQFY